MNTSLSWALAAHLAAPGAPRVFTPAILLAWLDERGIQSSRRHLGNLLTQAGSAGLVARAAHGLFINNQATPRPLPEEAAPFIRRDAIVSLQRALGRAGAINNPSNWITCVIPYGAGIAGGQIQVGASTFQFHKISPSLFMGEDHPLRRDAVVSGQPWMATPEKALLDWVYLARQPRSNLASPALHDVEMDMLDPDRLSRLAESMGLTDALEAWQSPAPPPPSRALRR